MLKKEKCYILVREGIVLGHKFSNQGLEVDKANVEVIEKLPPSISVKMVRNFLSHVRLYKTINNDFSKTRTMYSVFEEEVKLEFDVSYIEALRCLRRI